VKKIMIYIGFFVVGVLLYPQFATAEFGTGCGKGCNGQKLSKKQQPLDAEAKKKYEKFMLETADLRKELGEKQMEFESLMASENPDSSKVAMLIQEYYQLRDYLSEKAVLAGVLIKQRGCNGCNGKSGTACGLQATKKKAEKIN